MNPASPAAKLASLDSSSIDKYSMRNELEGFFKAFTSIKVEFTSFFLGGGEKRRWSFLFLFFFFLFHEVWKGI